MGKRKASSEESGRRGRNTVYRNRSPGRRPEPHERPELLNHRTKRAPPQLPQVHVSPALYLQTSQVKAIRTGPRSQALSSRSEPWALELAPTPPRAGTPAEPSSLKISKDQALISKNLRGSRAPDISLHELPHCPVTSLFLRV